MPENCHFEVKWTFQNKATSIYLSQIIDKGLVILNDETVRAMPEVARPFAKVNFDVIYFITPFLLTCKL